MAASSSFETKRSIEAQVDVLLQPTSATASAVYYAEHTRGTRVRVVPNIAHGKGKGLVAAEPIKEGELVLSEPPLVGVQDTDNAAVVSACQHCFAILGPTLEAHLGHAIQVLRDMPDLETSPDSADEEDEEGSDTFYFSVSESTETALRAGKLKLPGSMQYSLPQPVPCRSSGGPLYCSAACEARAWDAYQRLLSPCMPSGRAGGRGQAMRRAALRDLADYAVASNPVFGLVARAMAGVLVSAAGLTDAVASGDAASSEANWAALLEAWQPLAQGQKELWWELPVMGEDEEDRREMCGEATKLLRAALWDPRFPALFDVRVVASLVGMVELNNLAMVVESPALDWAARQGDGPSGGSDAVDTAASSSSSFAPCTSTPTRQVVRFVRSLGHYLNVDGTAFYRLHSCCNHSCAPNAHAFKRPRDATGTAVVLALRDIAPGEEITLSYIDEDELLEERRAALAEYGFLCTCGVCLDEEASAA